jgi:hypothetical protein
MDILASTNILKCRFCSSDEEDSSRWATVGEGELKDPHFDLKYDKAENVLRDATINTRYAYVECPKLKCARCFIEGDGIEEKAKEKFISLEDMLIRTEETDDLFLKQFSEKPSVNILRLVEQGTVMCSCCGHYDEQDTSEKMFSIVYAPTIAMQPLLHIRCKPHKCERIIFIRKAGGHYTEFVQIRESAILKLLGVTVEPLEKLEIYNPEEVAKEIQQAVETFKSMPDVVESNIIERYLSTLTGKRVTTR